MSRVTESGRYLRRERLALLDMRRRAIYAPPKKPSPEEHRHNNPEKDHPYGEDDEGQSRGVGDRARGVVDAHMHHCPPCRRAIRCIFFIVPPSRLPVSPKVSFCMGSQTVSGTWTEETEGQTYHAVKHLRGVSHLVANANGYLQGRMEASKCVPETRQVAGRERTFLSSLTLALRPSSASSFCPSKLSAVRSAA